MGERKVIEIDLSNQYGLLKEIDIIKEVNLLPANYFSLLLELWDHYSVFE